MYIKHVRMEQPIGFEVKGKEGLAYRLQKALYGLKQTPRASCERIDSFLNKEFVWSKIESTLYIWKEGHDILLLCSYVYLIYIGTSPTMRDQLKESRMKVFGMMNLGLMNHLLGMEMH